MSKGFKDFLDDVDGKTYQDKILNLMKQNNPKVYEQWLTYQEEKRN